MPLNLKERIEAIEREIKQRQRSVDAYDRIATSTSLSTRQMRARIAELRATLETLKEKEPTNA